MSHLQFELGHAPFELQELHVKACLLSFEVRDLLLYAGVLRLLVAVVPLHLILNLLELSRQCLPHIVCLCVEYGLKRLFLGTQHLHLSLVIEKFVSETRHELL